MKNTIFERGDEMSRIKIVSAIMGAGKSTAVKMELEKKFQNGCTERFIYICPFLKHIEDEEDDVLTGFIADIPSGNFKQPISGYNISRERVESKLDNTHTLLLERSNIATTHALFKNFTDETKELLRLNNYHIIIDEVVDLVTLFNMESNDFNFLVRDGILNINEDTNVVTWDTENECNYNGLLKNYSEYFKTGTVYLYSARETKNSGTVRLCAWTFDVDMFNELNFTILTYMFHGSMMHSYFKLYDIQYTMYSIYNQEIVPYTDGLDADAKRDIAKLINLYEGKLNKIGDRKTSLSKNWFARKIEIREQLKKHLVSYRQRHAKSEASDTMWTTFKDSSKYLKGNGISVDTVRYKGNFVQCNEIGSNEYGDKHTVIYAMNRYALVDYKKYFESNGVTVDEDSYSLIMMLQWIWRSAIRNGEEINLYIPSSRMRNLFKEWLEN